MPREKEFDSMAQCPFQQGTLVPQHDKDGRDALWSVSQEQAVQADSLCCVYSPPDTSLRLPPMYRKTPRTGPRWKPNMHFHQQLKVMVLPSTAADEEQTNDEALKEDRDESEQTEQPDSTPKTTSASFFFSFEAIAREGIAVALSPQPKYTGGNTYEIFYGDRGNTQTLMERHQKIGSDKIHVTMPGRHCSDKVWTEYWIALHRGKVYAGIGKQPPNQCLGVLDDIAKQDQPIETLWYVGIGNSSMKRQGEQPFFNQYRNLRLAPLPLPLQQALSEIDASKLPIVNVHEEEMDDETKALLKEYEQECEKARARAEKYGLPYKEPPSFLPWSKVRRLQANPKDGFATGLDLQDPAEKAKQEARRKRFGIETAETPAGDRHGEEEGLLVPIAHAWDNEKFVRSQRADPPQKLWKVVPTSGQAETNEAEIFAMQPIEANIVPEKIHLFAIDWAAFKQIRTNDLSAYFSMYSPTYIEWLGDLCCNIHFQDKFSASRALENLSQEIPTPPPPQLERSDGNDEIPDLGAMGWRLGKTMLRKVADDRYGRRGTRARVLLRLATSLDVLRDKPSAKAKAPPGFSRTRVLGPGSEFSRDNKGEGKRSRGDRNRDEMRSNQALGGEPALLSGSLKASRSGFTVEDMEAERAKKRTKISEGKLQSEEGGAIEEKD